MLCIFLLRDVFESLKCCLDLQLSSLLDCIHFYVFSLKNCFLSSSTASRQILNKQLSIEPLGLIFSTNLIASSIHQAIWNLSRQLFDRFSIHRESFYLADSCSIAVQSIEVFLLSTDSICRDLVLDRSSIHRAVISLNSFNAKSVFTFSYLSRQKSYLSPSKHSFLSQNSLPTRFSALSKIKSLGKLSKSFTLHAFHLDLGFGFS